MRIRFSTELQNFASAIDIVEKPTLESVWDAIGEYVGSRFQYREILQVTTSQQGPALSTFRWTIESKPDSYPMYDGENVHGQTSFVCLQSKPAWIVDRYRRPLSESSESSEIEEQWSRLSNLPKYISAPHGLHTRTSVIHPLQHGTHTFGVVNFESTEHITLTESLKEDITAIAEALSMLVPHFNAYNSQHSGTKKSLKRLAKAAEHPIQVDLPTVFVASPSYDKCDRAVIKSLREVLKSFESQFQTVFWKDISQTGSVTEQIRKAIAHCSFGVCYLSERVKQGSGFEYHDNPNVLFEAGMLHSLSFDPASILAGWIPVREGTTSIPFDIRPERILDVPRRPNQTLDTRKLKDALSSMITESWLNRESKDSSSLTTNHVRHSL